MGNRVQQKQVKKSNAEAQMSAAKENTNSGCIDPILSLQRKIGNQALHQLIQGRATLQPKLKTSVPGDRSEQEADRVAERVIRGASKGGAAVPIRPLSGVVSRPLPAELSRPLMGAGRALSPSLRQNMEQRFGHDFSRVHTHTGPQATASAQALGARAYTVGSSIVFNSSQYAPATRAGQRLLAHELTHVVQQSDGGAVIQRDMYLPEERRAMAQGQMAGTAIDRQIASSCGFEPGDIVFRLGSQQLADRIGEPVTHGGIYIGNGLIHDMVGFGNRSVPVTLFYAEAADPSVVKIVRFIGPQRERIVQRVVANVRSQDFSLPTDPVPWNLFSSASDYRTATCLEYSHAQFLYAIHQLERDTSQPPDVLAELRRTYFASNPDAPDALIAPRRLRGGWPVGSILERWLLVAAADYLAEDVDPAAFENRWEGNADESLDAFTYSSFVNATQFFQTIDCDGSSAGAAVGRLRRQVMPIGETGSTHRTDPIDRTITTQIGVVWAQQEDGRSYLVLIRIANSSVRRPTGIQFITFIDTDLRTKAISRARLRQPRGVQTLPWSRISGIPDRPTATAARRD